MICVYIDMYIYICMYDYSIYLIYLQMYMIRHMIYIRRLPVPQARLAIPVLHHTLKVTVRPRKGLRNPSQTGQLQSEQRQRGEPP